MRWRISLFLLLLSFLPAPVRAEEILSYAGATTLQRDFMPEAAQLFRQETGISFRIAGGNTDPGLKALLDGKVLIAGAGRFLRPEEKASGLVGTLIGWDPIVIMVHRTNPIDSLTRKQLQGIFSGRIRNWREVGGEDLPILIVSSPQGSGMRATVQKEILKDEAYTTREIISVLVADADRQVAGLPAAIGAISKSMVEDPEIRVICVDGICPDAKTINGMEYPLVKPLLLVTRGKPIGTTARFIAFALGRRGQKILARKFYTLD